MVTYLSHMLDEIWGWYVVVFIISQKYTIMINAVICIHSVMEVQELSWDMLGGDYNIISFS